jgi:hypothetical protein
MSHPVNIQLKWYSIVMRKEKKGRRKREREGKTWESNNPMGIHGIRLS